jgi:hypothetical protein
MRGSHSLIHLPGEELLKKLPGEECVSVNFQKTSVGVGQGEWRRRRGKVSAK